MIFTSKNTLLKISAACVILLNTHCDNNLTAEIPSYIEIQKIDYITNNSSTIPHPNNYHSVNITDAWITMNGQTIGVFELPCKIPILNEGLHAFDITPGIKVNGISGDRRKYPFYEKFQTEIIIDRENTTQILPVTAYKSNTQSFYSNEGQFEIPGQGTILEAAPTSDTMSIIQDEVVFQGSKSVAIYLDSSNSYFDIRNIEALELPTNTFLELNFKSNINFNVGLIIVNDSDIEQKQELIQLYPTENWKKIYLELTPLINMGNSLSKFKIYFEGNYSNLELENAVYLDNLKLVFSK